MTSFRSECFPVPPGQPAEKVVHVVTLSFASHVDVLTEFGETFNDMVKLAEEIVDSPKAVVGHGGVYADVFALPNLA